jgi:hypothetical protein
MLDAPRNCAIRLSLYTVKAVLTTAVPTNFEVLAVTSVGGEDLAKFVTVSIEFAVAYVPRYTQKTSRAGTETSKLYGSLDTGMRKLFKHCVNERCVAALSITVLNRRRQHDSISLTSVWLLAPVTIPIDKADNRSD